MILPQPRQDTRRRRSAAIGGTLLLMMGLHAGLRGTPIPTFGSSQAMIRELNPLFVERYATPPPPEVDEAVADEVTPDVGARLDQEVGEAIDELVRLFEPGGIGGGRQRARADASLDGAAGIESTPTEDRFTALFGDAGDPASVTAPRARTTTTRGETRAGGIGIESRRDAPGTRSDGGLGDVDVDVAAPRARAAERRSTEVVIEDFEAGNLNLGEVDALSRWMQANPSDLPVGVKVHLNYSDAFLTAAQSFVSGDRELELYLMFNAGLRELHIVLVEGDRSVYLIDRGFQEQSRSLREGIVQRLEGEIMVVDSRAGAATSDRASEFYDIFLSWWTTAKRNVQP